MVTSQFSAPIGVQNNEYKILQKSVEAFVKKIEFLTANSNEMRLAVLFL